MMNVIRSLTATLVLCGLGLCVVCSAAAVPRPPPKFWSPTHCERMLLRFYGNNSHVGDAGQPLPDGNGHYFHVAQAFCVGSGGAHACRWTTGHRSPRYAEFRVFTRSPLNGGVVRSWTLATRSSPGLVKIVHRHGPQYVGWPADFYMSTTSLLATDVTPADLRLVVGPPYIRLARQQNAAGCTGG